MTYRIGLDIGSKTVKIVILDEEDFIVFSLYRRHRSDVKTTILEIIRDTIARFGAVSGYIAITGSAGIELSSQLQIPFVQEVIAARTAVVTEYPQTEVIVEVGGEDAKIVYLSGVPEQRMNASCAGGTGGFIDTVAFMLGMKIQEFAFLKTEGAHIYPIASRCAVFAQSDIRPLLYSGARKADIAASTYRAVSRQLLGGLAAGRPIQGTVALLGGPFEFLPELVRHFVAELGTEACSCFKPADAHLFAAKGAAISADRDDRATDHANYLDLEEVLSRVADIRAESDELACLEPLFEDEAAYLRFRERHDHDVVSRATFPEKGKPLFVGIDAGSTAVKIAVTDECGRLLYSERRRTGGNVLKSALELLKALYVTLSDHGYQEADLPISHTCVTGYGEDLLITALQADSGVVETTAHLTAAQSYQPDASFVLDIGGQDMKALWIEDGVIVKAVLNEACSSGCGAFIEGTAHSLGSSPSGFSTSALAAQCPLDFGSRCTVFMTSRVKHAQKIGASREDIAAGISYSAVHNAIFKMIGLSDMDSLGETIIVQGGTFLSDAVLRAFEKVTGKQAIRPDAAQYMGAYGAALVALKRAGSSQSTILKKSEIERLVPSYQTATCPGCANHCELSMVIISTRKAQSSWQQPRTDDVAPEDASDEERYFIAGNRCSRAYTALGLPQDPLPQTPLPPNLFSLQQELIDRYGDFCPCGHSTTGRASVKVGLFAGINMFASFPFWHTLIKEFGFTVLVGKGEDKKREGYETIPSESVCYPAKSVHFRIGALIEQGADYILYPGYERESCCAVACGYNQVIKGNIPQVVNGEVTLLTPDLAHITPLHIVNSPCDRERLLKALQCMAAPENPLSEDEFVQALMQACAEQNRVDEQLRVAGDHALAWMEKPGNHGILLSGRPYHVDDALCHGMDRLITSLGYAVISDCSIAHRMGAIQNIAPENGEGMSQDTPCHSPSEPCEHSACWSASLPLERTARYVADHPSLDMIGLRSFNCSYDAISHVRAKAIVEGAGKLFSSYKVDEIVDVSHIRIRLRTLFDAIESRARTEHQGRACLPERSSVGKTGAKVDADVELVVLGKIEYADIEVGKREVNQDVCATVSVVAGQIIRYCRDRGTPKRIVVERPCTSCLFDGLAVLVEEVLGYAPQIILREPCLDHGDIHKPIEAGDVEQRPRIGLLGNPLLVFTPEMNGAIADYLTSRGCEVIYPALDNLVTDDVRYLAQLGEYDAAQVDHVIYLQSFGCLRGHIGARGSLRAMSKLFPHVPITVIDCDPHASELNQTNRILLVLEALNAEKGLSLGKR